jgi:hypothetical protein
MFSSVSLQHSTAQHQPACRSRHQLSPPCSCNAVGQTEVGPANCRHCFTAPEHALLKQQACLCALFGHPWVPQLSHDVSQIPAHKTAMHSLLQTIFTPKPHRLMRTGCQLAAVPKVHPAADSCRHAGSKCLGVQAHLFSSRSMCSSGRGSAVDLKLMGRVASYNVKVWKLVSRIKLAICSTASPTLVVMSYATWSIQQQRAYADELTPKPQNIQLATAVTCGCPNSHPNRHAEPGGHCVWPECLRCCSTVAVALTSSNVSSRKKMIVVSLLPPMCALISSTDGSCSTHPHTQQ